MQYFIKKYFSSVLIRLWKEIIIDMNLTLGQNVVFLEAHILLHYI